MRTHTADKLWQCSGCSKSFVDENRVKRHQGSTPACRGSGITKVRFIFFFLKGRKKKRKKIIKE